MQRNILLFGHIYYISLSEFIIMLSIFCLDLDLSDMITPLAHNHNSGAQQKCICKLGLFFSGKVFPTWAHHRHPIIMQAYNRT